jgi:catechol 2,3-dioxygenase-like lactoylglutathione lyase family enzyme
MNDQPRMQLTGLHHLTAICRDLDATTAFYRDVLGLKLVREAVSDDDPGARHFWFAIGDAMVSFLEYPQLPPTTVGTGSVQHFAFGVGSAAEQLAWRDWLRSRGVECTDVLERGEFSSIYVKDPDGHVVEIATGGRGGLVSEPAPRLPS